MDEEETIQTDTSRPSTPTDNFADAEQRQAEDFKNGGYYDEVKDTVAETETEEPEVESKPDTDTLKRVDHKIPYERFRDVNERAKNLQSQNEQLQARLAELEENKSASELEAKLDSLEDARDQAMMEGDLDKLKELRKQIREVNKQIAHDSIQTTSQQASIKSQEESLLADTAVRLMEEYPIFDSKSPTFNQSLVDEVAKLQVGMIATGQNSAQALQEAVDIVAYRYNLTPTSAQSKEAETTRKQQAVKRNLEAAAKQPPSTNKLGSASDASGMGNINPMTLSYDDFEKLTPSQLAKLRGDYLN